MKSQHRSHEDVEGEDLDWIAEDASAPASASRPRRMLWWGVSPSLVRKAGGFAAIVTAGALGVAWMLPVPEPVMIPEGFFEVPGRLDPPTHEAGEPTAAEPQLLYVHVAGEVTAPGLIHLPAGSRVADALDRVGGPTEDANLSAINLAAHVHDGEQILVPAIGEPLPPGPSPTRTESALVNLNTGGVTDFQTLPGIGPVLAERIVAYRTTHGPFTSIDDLRAVPGIGPVMMAQLVAEVTL